MVVAAPAADPGNYRRRLLVQLDSLLWWVLEEKIIALQHRTYRRALRLSERRLQRRRDAYFECRLEFGDEDVLTQTCWSLAFEAQSLEHRLSEQAGILIVGNEGHWPWGTPKNTNPKT